MVWFVAVVAVLNICLGYALAVHLGAGRRRATYLPARESAAVAAPPAMSSHATHELHEEAIAAAPSEPYIERSL